jgi:hypothetical protein
MSLLLFCEFYPRLVLLVYSVKEIGNEIMIEGVRDSNHGVKHAVKDRQVRRVQFSLLCKQDESKERYCQITRHSLYDFD